MRVCLSLFLLFAPGFTANAQLEKGRHFAGVQTTLLISDLYNTYLSIASNEIESAYGMNLVPTYGWAVSRNWLIGAQVNIGYLKSTLHSSKTVTHYYDLGFTPYTRLYFDLSRNQRFKAFGQLGLEIAGTKSRTDNGVTSQGTQIAGSYGGGLSYFFNKLALDLNISGAGIRFGVYKTFGQPRHH
jgi:hypothetical protein